MNLSKWELPSTVNKLLEKTTATLEESLSTAGSEGISEILRYPMSIGGQMIRPILVYLTALAFDPEPDEKRTTELVRFSAAVEMLHNASLVHDDVLDREVSRRGEQCLYQKYGEKNAILTGNVYYIRAIALAVGLSIPILTMELLDTADKMCQGEMLQLRYLHEVMPDDVYFTIIRQKTARLTSLACRGAARISGAGEERVEELAQLGELMGMIYQLRDDYRDQDANVRKDFSFASTLKEFIGLAERLVSKLPESAYSNYFKLFIGKLGGTI